MPSVIHTWKVGDPLGRGQSGTVHEVTETVAPFRHGALKIHRGTRIKVSREQFLRESKFVASQPIPGYMPDFYDSGTLVDGTPWYVMEYAEKPPAHLTRDQVIAIVDRIAEALQLLDRKRHYHGDVKPNNIGLVNGKAILLDFGSVHSHGETEFTSYRLGTPYYMAPELKNGGMVSVRTDVFSLGMTLEELRDDEDRRVFGPVVQHATAHRTNDRPTYEVFRSELNDAVASYRRDAAKESRVEKVKAIAGRIGLAGFGLLALLFIVYLAYYHFGKANLTRKDDMLDRAKASEQLGFEAYKVNDDRKAAYYFKIAAETEGYDNKEVLNILSEFYRMGRGVDKDEATSREYARRAASSQ